MGPQPLKESIARYLISGLLSGLLGACGDHTGPSPTRYQPIPENAAVLRNVIQVTFARTLQVQGRCSGNFINCPNDSLAAPVAVALAPSTISLVPLPGHTPGYTYVADVEVSARQSFPLRIGGVACQLTLKDGAVITVGGNAVVMEPSDQRPHDWVDLTSAMMGGLERGSYDISGVGCDPVSFNPAGLSVMIGELLPHTLQICKPEGRPYQRCPDPGEGA